MFSYTNQQKKCPREKNYYTLNGKVYEANVEHLQLCGII